MVDIEKVKNCANDLRDIMNWVAVFEAEYNLPAEVVGQLNEKLEKVAQDLSSIE